VTPSAKVLQVKTDATTQVVIRNKAGKKLFDICAPGVSITLAVPVNAGIQIVPSQPEEES
jgi:hypothetical protein